MAARLAARYRAASTAAEHRISRWVDRMAAAGLTEPRCASERGLAMGGGRPAERRFTVGGSGKSVARCHRTVLAYWKFESISLQRRVYKPSVRLAISIAFVFQIFAHECRAQHRLSAEVPGRAARPDPEMR
jgi:hypothetical protein